MEKMKASVRIMIGHGWINPVSWSDREFMFKNCKFVVVTKTGKIRDLTKSEKEQLNLGA